MRGVAQTVLLLAFSISALPCPAEGETVSRSASCTFPDSVSDKDGCETALLRVKKEALEEACGTDFSGGAGRFRAEGMDEIRLFAFETVGGRVVNTLLQARDVSVSKNPSTGDFIQRCAVTATVDVRCDRGRRDPSFAPAFASSVQLNQTVFRDNDTLQINVPGSSGMHVSVFQYLPYEAADNVIRVFPNKMQRDSSLEEGQELKIPDYEISRGYRLVMRLPKDRDKVVEELMLVATKKKVAFPGSMSLNEFHRILSEIPLDERREAIIPYTIVQKGGSRRSTVANRFD